MPHFEEIKEAENGIQLFIQGWRPKKKVKAVIALVHGLGEHSGRYQDLANYLTEKGYCLIALDLQGHGKSQGSRGHISSYKDFMDNISVMMKEVNYKFVDTPYFLYGHSMGGNLVLNYVLRNNPDLRGIIISAPWLKLATKPSVIKEILAGLMSKILPGFSQANGINVNYLSRDQAVVQEYKQDSLVHNRISSRLFTEVQQAGNWALQNASKLKTPALIMQGSADKIVSAQAVGEFAGQVLKDCEYKIWKGFYHEIHNEPQKEEVYDYLLEWVKKYNLKEIE
ncbi:MAG: alpha/beta hydrolase [Halanaerobiales bacterium]